MFQQPLFYQNSGTPVWYPNGEGSPPWMNDVKQMWSAEGQWRVNTGSPHLNYPYIFGGNTCTFSPGPYIPTACCPSCGFNFVTQSPRVEARWFPTKLRSESGMEFNIKAAGVSSHFGHFGDAISSFFLVDNVGLKKRIVWTADMEEAFQMALKCLGRRATPKPILEFLKRRGFILTRFQVASHLQKYRLRQVKQARRL